MPTDMATRWCWLKALTRHPKLRLCAARGWPHLKGVLALMSTHSQLCVDISVIDWYLPREEFDKYLRPLVEAGFAKRIMFGSDELIWPDAIKLGVLILQARRCSSACPCIN
jgi:predicted TIM-barrel fold metal-dependent hydrolase